MKNALDESFSGIRRSKFWMYSIADQQIVTELEPVYDTSCFMRPFPERKQLLYPKKIRTHGLSGWHLYRG